MMAKHCIVIMNHERRRFVRKVQYITSAGFGTGGDWRIKNGIRAG
jgi:glutaconate CoA-transferase, subunit B